MPTEPWWGWVFLGRLHPLIVHFPIGLIAAGALYEIVRWARRRPVPSEIGTFCLALGLVTGGLAVWFGTLNASHQSITGQSAAILEWHRYAGWALLLAGAGAFLAGRVARSQSQPGRAAAAYTSLMAVAAVCVGVSGHFGGQLVYGSTYVTGVLPWNRPAETTARADAAASAPVDVPSTPESAPPAPESAAPTAVPVPTAAPAPVAAPTPVGAATTDAPPPHAAATAPSSGAASSDEGQAPRAPEVSSAPAATAAAAEEPVVTRVDFVRQVRPILEATCVECHGPDKVKARLRMDSVAALQQGGKSGPLLVPGDPDASLLMRRVLGLDDEDQMPLDNDPLTPEQIDTLRRWIAEGGHYAPPARADSQP